MDSYHPKKVFVGLSGGVDSAVTAYLLQQQGFHVSGVFIQTWTPPWMECSWKQDRRDAMRVAIHLGIPFHDLDLTEEYKVGVADYMIREYSAGRTPNPDVMCNKQVKFKGFLEFALRNGADYIATGHYAKTDNDNLYKGIDPAKDQSYFLWTLTREQLQHVLFPLGDITKAETRTIAEKAKIPVADKKDSQGICFLGHIDIKDFLLHYMNEHYGDIVDETGEVVGRHMGVNFYTVGERLGKEITDNEFRSKHCYVISKNVEQNILVAGHSLNHTHDSISEPSKIITLIEVNNSFGELTVGKKCDYQIRYHGTFEQCEIMSCDDKNQVITIAISSSIVIAPGQSIVLYDGDKIIGGGIVQ